VPQGQDQQHPAASVCGGVHRRNVFALVSRLDVTSFDAMDGAAFGFGPTRSDLTIRAGRDPLELLQLLLLILPLELSLQALLVLFVFGEVEVNKQVTPKYTALVAVVSVY
jgi:hypothetical protein